jgi:transcriptional regulator with XRE-family HTH domain
MLSAYETGKQKPSIETLEKILDALKVDLADLFNALEVVNERPPMGRPFHRSAGAWGVQPPPDVYQVLGIERPLAREEEAAMAEMLNGFHRLLRYFHHVIASGELPEAADGDEDGDGDDDGGEAGDGGGGSSADGGSPVKG